MTLNSTESNIGGIFDAMNISESRRTPVEQISILSPFLPLQDKEQRMIIIQNSKEYLLKTEPNADLKSGCGACVFSIDMNCPREKYGRISCGLSTKYYFIENPKSVMGTPIIEPVQPRRVDVSKNQNIPTSVIGTAPKGVKADSGKTQWWYLGNVVEPMIQVMDVLTYGDTKYPAEDGANWKLVPNAKKRYTSALYRHLTAWQNGEVTDPETNKHHLAHLIANALFLLWFELKGYK